jgi:hypothetical protein
MLETVNAAMRALLVRYGCLDAAGAVLDARWGRGASKGTLSKKAAGHLDWTLADVIALEDGMAVYPVTDMMVRRMRIEPSARGVDLSEGAGEIAREAGEAVAAVLAAAASGRAGDLAQALVELSEARMQIEAMEAALRARQEGGRHG